MCFYAIKRFCVTSDSLFLVILILFLFIGLRYCIIRYIYIYMYVCIYYINLRVPRFCLNGIQGNARLYFQSISFSVVMYPHHQKPPDCLFTKHIADRLDGLSGFRGGWKSIHEKRWDMRREEDKGQRREE